MNRKDRADSIREIRKLAKMLLDQSKKDKHVTLERKKNIKIVVNNEKN
tara:strand:+ start:34 stop:177 length:144 start_codon:yes stop_codon:yes gene_type:complete